MAPAVPEPTPARVAALVRTALADRAELDVEQPEPMGGYQHDLWAVTARWSAGGLIWTPPASHELVLRLFRSPLTWWATADTDKPQRELALAPILRAAGLPVAPVLAAGVDPAGLGPFSLMERAPGRPWFHPSVDVREILTPLIQPHAANLAALHAVPLASVAGFPLPRVSVPDALRHYRELAERAGAADVVTMADRLADLTAGRAELPAVVVNGGPDFGNVLVDDAGHLASWLDWEDAAVADPRWDVAAVVAYLRVFKLADLGQRFADAYTAAGGQRVDDLTLWLALIALRGWALTSWLAAEHAAGRAPAFPGLDHWLFSLPRYRAAAQTALQRAEGWGRLQAARGTVTDAP